MSNYHYISGRVLKGQERRDFIERVGIGYAQFEREYWGMQITPLDRSYVVGETRGRYRDENGHVSINISAALIKACQRRAKYWRNTLIDLEGQPTERRGI